MTLDIKIREQHYNNWCRAFDILVDDSPSFVIEFEAMHGVSPRQAITETPLFFLPDYVDPMASLSKDDKLRFVFDNSVDISELADESADEVRAEVLSRSSLPFGSVLFVDNANCTLMLEIADTKLENLQDIMPQGVRYTHAVYSWCAIAATDEKTQRNDPQPDDYDSIVISFVDYNQLPSATDYTDMIRPALISVVHPQRLLDKANKSRVMTIPYSEILKSPPAYARGLLNHTFSQIWMAFIGCWLINTPVNFVVRKELVKQKKRKGVPKKCPRAHAREHYVFLTSTAILKETGLDGRGEDVELLNEDGTARKKRRPHPRKGHFRFYRSEVYTHMKGKRKWISPIWIGPTSADVGTRRYVVMIDLGQPSLSTTPA